MKAIEMFRLHLLLCIPLFFLLELWRLPLLLRTPQFSFQNLDPHHHYLKNVRKVFSQISWDTVTPLYLWSRKEKITVLPSPLLSTSLVWFMLAITSWDTSISSWNSRLSSTPENGIMFLVAPLRGTTQEIIVSVS